MKQPGKVMILVETSNAAFDKPDHGWQRELGRILRKLAHELDSGHVDLPKRLFDADGDGVGLFNEVRKLSE